MRISNEKHAAIILKCLPRAKADRFLEALDPESCSSIVRLMQDIEVTTDKLQAAIARLESEGLGGARQLDESIQNRPIGNSVTQDKEESPFAFLTNIDRSVLRRLFNREHSRTAATILSTLPKEFASTILMDLEPPKRVEVIRQLTSLTSPNEKELVDLRFSLRLRIQKLLNDPASSVPVSSAADKDRDDSLDSARPYETLHKLSDLSNKQIKQLLKRVDTSHLAPALKTLPIQLQRKVLRNMASKPAAIVSKEIINVRIDDKHRIERSSRSVARAIQELNKK